MMKYIRIVLCTALLALSACSRSIETASKGDASPDDLAPTASTNANDYPVFPDADGGADPSVPAEQGGRGFKGEGWDTNTSYDFVGDPRAVKGGFIRTYIPDFPGTLRMFGPEANTQLNDSIRAMVYESLVVVHPTTQEFVPALATHWQIDTDKMTYRFRLNPNARYSDGQPVVADDVVATWTLLTDRSLQSPADYEVFTRFEKPVAESKYIVRVKSKAPRWINFYTIAAMPLFPSSSLKHVDGATYLKDFNFTFLPGTGPYIVADNDIEKGKSVSLRRRKDYWASKARIAAGMYNFDEVKHVVVRDQNLAFEMLKKGDLDFYPVNRASVWARDLEFDRIQSGLIQKRRIFNNQPGVIQGFAMNTRKPPFDDIRVRQALTHLFNREQIIEKLLFNAYMPMNSYESGTEYENPNNPRNEFNPQLALKLLAQAGWTDKDAHGRLMKQGRPLEFELLYDNKSGESYMTVFQEDLRKVGITLKLRLVTPETRFKLVMERKFEMSPQAWVNTLLPDPENIFSSKLADLDNTNNITGLKDLRVDQLIAEYQETFDRQERVRILQELDLAVASLHHYILHWYSGYSRIVFWNKFGMPKGLLSRTGGYIGSVSTGPGIPQLWWFSASRSRRIDEALRNPAIKTEVGLTDERYWIEHGTIRNSLASKTGDATKTGTPQ